MTRLFVALRPPAAVRERLLNVMGGVRAARWQSDCQLHLTLRFVGEMTPPEAEDLASQLGRIAAPPFDLQIKGVGHFEAKGRVSALWAAVSPSPELEILQRKVERACQHAGLTPERRRFKPHVTLARLGDGAGPSAPWLSANGALTAEPWPVEEFRLYQSRLAPTGSRYDPLIAYRLRT